MKSYRKPYRVKRKNPILKNRFLRLGVFFLIMISSISYLLFFSGFFQIEKIIFTGDKIFSEENISAFIVRKNIFLADINDIEKEILGNFPQAAKVEIDRNLPDTLSIFVEKRMPAAFWCESDECFLIDNDGVVFGEAADENLMKILGKKEMLKQEKIAQILSIRNKLRDIAGVTTTLAAIVSGQRLDVAVSEGWEIYFNTEGNLDWQIQELSLILEKQISPQKRKNLEYIDLRFSRVYYK